jgi:rare lipoprotein A (peptidoglycan hydrolase)
MLAIPMLALRSAPAVSEPVAAAPHDTGAALVVRSFGPEVSRSSRFEVAQEALATTTTTAPAPPPTTVRRAVTTTARHQPTSTTTTLPPAPKPTTAKPASTPTTKAPAPSTSAPPSGNSQTGGATWYDAAPAGTCAHRTLPFGTVVTITNQSNGATATCTVGDRGPYADGMVIDLAKDVFSKLAPLSTGVIQVRISW